MTPETRAARDRIEAYLDADDPSITPNAVVNEFTYGGNHFELRHADLRTLLAALDTQTEPPIEHIPTRTGLDYLATRRRQDIR